jgi:hypothetical protein
MGSSGYDSSPSVGNDSVAPLRNTEYCALAAAIVFGIWFLYGGYNAFHILDFTLRAYQFVGLWGIVHALIVCVAVLFLGLLAFLASNYYLKVKELGGYSSQGAIYRALEAMQYFWIGLAVALVLAALYFLYWQARYHGWLGTGRNAWM